MQAKKDFAEVMLMDNTHLQQDKTNVWYLDASCNNHIAGNKN